MDLVTYFERLQSAKQQINAEQNMVGKGKSDLSRYRIYIPEGKAGINQIITLNVHAKIQVLSFV
jgi:hypothetical protein